MNTDLDPGYAWETEYERPWEQLQEDASGSLAPAIHDVVFGQKRRRFEERRKHGTGGRLGMMRHISLVIDYSELMRDQDLKPTRLQCVQRSLHKFIDQFFDQNPVSQLGILLTRNKRVERLCPPSGNAKELLEAVDGLSLAGCSGEPSLQNALEVSAISLRHIPAHASREIIIVYGALTSCDAGDITTTIQSVKDLAIRVSVIGLSGKQTSFYYCFMHAMLVVSNMIFFFSAAEMKVCRDMCKETGGRYWVIVDESHLLDTVMSFIEPPPANDETECMLLRVGFPKQHLTSTGGKSLVTAAKAPCLCHLDQPAEKSASSANAQASDGGGAAAAIDNSSRGVYFCPQCLSKYCKLPIECRVCGLTLLAAPHLARSYHHLFPLDPFEEVQAADLENGAAIDDVNTFTGRCTACQIDLVANRLRHPKVFRCRECKSIFCTDCDIFLHEALHYCPICND